MKAVIYAQYSCDNQKEESIEGQVRECREYAAQNGISVVGIYADHAVSARSDKRPEFQRMVVDSKTRKFQAVLVWKFDQFSRKRADSALYNPAKRLPAGWFWHEYEDGSGSLCSPEGQSYYIYDLSPYHSQGGIEYKKNEADLYGVFFGSFAEFKSYAEEEMRMVLSVTPQGNTAQFGLGM